MPKSLQSLMPDARPQSHHDAATHRPAAAPAHLGSHSLLSGPQARTRGNSGVQAAMLLQMQQTYGNRAVQRAVQSAPPGHRAASEALMVAAEVLKTTYTPHLGGIDPRYYVAIQSLYQAKDGTRDGLKLRAAEQLRLLDSGLAGLQSAMSALGPSNQNWVDFYIHAPARQLRSDLNYEQARERVKEGIVHPESLPPSANPRAEAQALRKGITKVVKTGGILNEQLSRLGEHLLAADLEAFEEAGEHAPIPAALKAGKTGLGVLAEISNVLTLADGFLTLTDEEFQHKLTHIQDVCGGVASYADLVKATINITAGAIGVMASFTAITARVLKQADLVTPALELARGLTSAGLDTGLKVGERAVEVSLGTVLSFIDIVHGAAVIADSTSTPDEKVEGARDIVMGSTGIVVTLKVDSATGGVASLAVLLTYYLAVYAAYLHNSARSGIMGIWQNFALKAMDRSGQRLQEGAAQLVAVSQLLVAEQNPAQQVALAQVQQEAAAGVGAVVDSFLDSCRPVELTKATVGKVGAYPEIAIHFAALQSLRGARTPEHAMVAVTAVLEKLIWVHEHAAEIKDGSVGVLDELNALSAGGVAAPAAPE